MIIKGVKVYVLWHVTEDWGVRGEGNAGEEKCWRGGKALVILSAWIGSSQIWCCVIGIPLQKAVSRAQFSIFFQNSFFAELEIWRATFPKKKIWKSMHKLAHESNLKVPRFFFAMVMKPPAFNRELLRLPACKISSLWLSWLMSHSTFSVKNDVKYMV